MSTSNPDGARGSSRATGGHGGARHVQEIVLGVLVLLSGIGIAVNDTSPSYGYKYWMAMAPVFGAVSLLAAWSRASSTGQALLPVVGRQILHWLGLCAMVYLLYRLQAAGRMTNEAAGLAALSALALASYLSGVHGDWRFCVVGFVLACTVVAIAWVEEFMWMVILPVVVIAVLAAWIAARRNRAQGGAPVG